ncbi:hypothetical protein MAM1_0266d08940 [Mucor ambiguus]|uniref:Uncharacterized protein n=1 Tax=Mucor ambiguus TaxID=91626 RepID=A0A0C9N4A7_9FUNG|nr:hypothetical protein MAM1_0266d08940 [Mucor ambiguus]
MSVEYSNIDPELLTYEGNQYNHLSDVLVAKTESLTNLLNLNGVHIPPGEVFTSVEHDHTARALEETEEKELLSKDVSKFSKWFTKCGISFKQISLGPITIDPNVFLPAVFESGESLLRLGLQPFGDTREVNMPSFTTLIALKPMMEHLFGLGTPLKYDTPFQRQEESGITLTHASFTFEDVTALFPVFHSVLFCGQKYNGSVITGFNIRKGFTAGLFLKAPEKQQFAVRRRNREVENLVDAMWRKGGSYKADAVVEAKWNTWNDFNSFNPTGQAKGSSIRDLVRFCWNKCKVTIMVEDKDSAAIAFGLAQVGLCRIEMLDMGPVGGVTVFGRQEYQVEALRLEPSMIMNSYSTYSYSRRKSIFDICNVPIEFEEPLMKWLDGQIKETLLLGIENGDPPGTIIMTPEFTVLADTGLMMCLGKEIEGIAIAAARRCTSCDGECVSKVTSTEGLKHQRHACATVSLLNTLVTIYVGGVLLKGGMDIDQCTISSNLDITLKALKRLGFASILGLESLLASWFILRTGNDAPDTDYGPVLGIEMEGRIHGLRYAIKPGSVGSTLVSFHGHIFDGRHSCSCLVFEPCYQSNDIPIKRAHTEIILEQKPDIKLQQILFIHSMTTYIAVETCLVFPGGGFLQVQLGQDIEQYKTNQHKCTEMPDILLATPLHLSECVDGNSSIDIEQHGLRYVLYTYGNEAIQSWVCGLFPVGKVCFQGSRSLGHSMALLEEGDILIQGWSDRPNAIQDGQNLEGACFLNKYVFILHHSTATYIAVKVLLRFSDERSIEVQLGDVGAYAANQHRCTERPDSSEAVPLPLSSCVQGRSSVYLQENMQYALHTYGNEAIQSWVCGLFPADQVRFQGCRSLSHSMALLEVGKILIQGWPSRSNAMQEGQTPERAVARLSIQQ